MRLTGRQPWLPALIGLFWLLAGCGREPLHQSQSYVFGTLVTISIYGESAERAAELSSHIEQEFRRLHQELHAWKPGGELYRLNQAFASGKSAPVSAELGALITEAGRISAQSGELFNPAIGGLIALWGFQRDEFTPVTPAPAAIRRWVAAHPRMADIVLTDDRAASRNPAVRLDLGGYAKGYALDLAANYLRRQQIRGALVNIGGNIIAIGRHGKRPWRVGIQHPRAPGPLATTELGDGWAIGTSGDYQRYFVLDGVRYSHLIDPRSGHPAQGVQAVTVLVPPGPHAGALSDALSKPLFIAGETGWQQLAQRLDITHAMLVNTHGEILLTPGLRGRLHFMDRK